MRGDQFPLKKKKVNTAYHVHKNTDAWTCEEATRRERERYVREPKKKKRKKTLKEKNYACTTTRATHTQTEFFFLFLFFRHKHTVWHTDMWVCSGGAVTSHTHTRISSCKTKKKREKECTKFSKKKKREKKELAEIKRWPKEKIKHNNAVDSLCSRSWSKKRRKKKKTKWKKKKEKARQKKKKKSMSIYSDNIEESGYSIQKKNKRGKPACKSRRKQEKKRLNTVVPLRHLELMAHFLSLDCISEGPDKLLPWFPFALLPLAYSLFTSPILFFSLFY